MVIGHLRKLHLWNGLPIELRTIECPNSSQNKKQFTYITNIIAKHNYITSIAPVSILEISIYIIIIALCL